MQNEKNTMSRRDLMGAAALAAGALSSGRLAGAEASAGDIKLGLYSITYLGLWYRGDALTLQQVVDRAKEYGYQGVEVDGKRPHGDPLDMNKYQCTELRRYAERQGIEIYAVAGNNDFSSPIPEVREAQLLYFRELLRMAADLDVKTVRVFLAWPGVTAIPEGGGRYDLTFRLWDEAHKGIPDERTWDWCRDGLRESVKYASDHGITLALQNHPPVIHGYHDVLRMVKEIDSPNLKVCFDARLEHEMTPEDVVRATHEIGPLQALSHYGNEYTEENGRIVPKNDEKMPAQVKGLLETGYKGYLGFELCHQLPQEGGRLVGIDFADKNARLAAKYARDLIAETKKQLA